MDTYSLQTNLNFNRILQRSQSTSPKEMSPIHVSDSEKCRRWLIQSGIQCGGDIVGVQCNSCGAFSPKNNELTLNSWKCSNLFPAKTTKRTWYRTEGKARTWLLFRKILKILISADPKHGWFRWLKATTDFPIHIKHIKLVGILREKLYNKLATLHCHTSYRCKQPKTVSRTCCRDARYVLFTWCCHYVGIPISFDILLVLFNWVENKTTTHQDEASSVWLQGYTHLTSTSSSLTPLKTPPKLQDTVPNMVLHILDLTVFRDPSKLLTVKKLVRLYLKKQPKKIVRSAPTPPKRFSVPDWEVRWTVAAVFIFIVTLDPSLQLPLRKSLSLCLGPDFGQHVGALSVWVADLTHTKIL